MQAESIYLFLDPLFISAFRLPDSATLGFALGVAWLALITTIVGELAMAVIFLLNRKHFGELRHEMVSNNNLSLQALAAKDKTSYKACNDLANEAFGRNFFSGIALFASSVWPAFFALGWLQFRFTGVEFTLPLVGSVGAAFWFVPVYIIFRIAFSLVRSRLPLFSLLSRKAKASMPKDEMLTYMDLLKDDQRPAAK